jgi:hypothetical protein
MSGDGPIHDVKGTVVVNETVRTGDQRKKSGERHHVLPVGCDAIRDGVQFGHIKATDQSWHRGTIPQDRRRAIVTGMRLTAFSRLPPESARRMIQTVQQKF